MNPYDQIGDQERELIRFQTCDDDCPGNRYYRIIARPQEDGFDVETFPEIVRQQWTGDGWIDDTEDHDRVSNAVVGFPGIDGSYEVVAQNDE